MLVCFFDDVDTHRTPNVRFAVFYRPSECYTASDFPSETGISHILSLQEGLELF